MDIKQATQGRWRDILPRLGIPAEYLISKAGPCPKCGGKDRYVFDDKDGRGTYFCRGSCGAGSGFDMLMNYHGWDFKRTVREIEAIVGSCTYRKPPPEMSVEQRRQQLNALWRTGRPIEQGDPVDRYLEARGIAMDRYPDVLRTIPEAITRCKQRFPMMLAMVEDVDGRPVSLHRTWISGDAKAPIDSPRAIMPGKLPDCLAVRLEEHYETLGIAEGIETALSCTRLFGVPTWSVLNARHMYKFVPPEGVKKLVIYGDHDAKYGGQASAYGAAHRLRDVCEVEVKIPPRVGDDWNDVWRRELARKAA